MKINIDLISIHSICCLHIALMCCIYVVCCDICKYDLFVAMDDCLLPMYPIIPSANECCQSSNQIDWNVFN